MKKLILILLVFTTGCVTPQSIGDSMYATGYDFRPYTEQGFLITPEQYLGKYESIGLITVTLWPEVRQERVEGRNPGYSEFYIGELDDNKVIDELYKLASEMGANAITRFNVNNIERRDGNTVIPGVRISGFAIRRHIAAEIN